VKIVVASSNPVKLNAVESAFAQTFPNEALTIGCRRSADE